MIGRRGFTLFELVIVLALIGLLGGVALVGVSSRGRRGAHDEAVRAIERRLLEARVDAMQRTRVNRVRVEFRDDRLVLLGYGGEAVVEGPGLSALDELARDLDALEVSFAPHGRADVLVWRIADEELDRQRAYDLGLLDAGRVLDGGDAATSGIGGRLWLIRFDPVSGAPSVEVLQPER
ncbi:MAG: Tfp pilus assembly protein FimT/FimU [Phycisphaerales bacterium JB065]